MKFPIFDRELSAYKIDRNVEFRNNKIGLGCSWYNLMRYVVIASFVWFWCELRFLSSFVGILVDPLWLVMVYSEVVGRWIRLELSVAQVFNFSFFDC